MKVKYQFQDGEFVEIEVSENIGKIIVDMERTEENSNRKERYHRVNYNGTQLSTSIFKDDKYSPEAVIENDTYSKKLFAALDILSPTQKRRFLMYADGMSIMEIAAAEKVNHAAVVRSIKAAQKKIKTYIKFQLLFFQKIVTKTGGKSPIYERVIFTLSILRFEFTYAP